MKCFFKIFIFFISLPVNAQLIEVSNPSKLPAKSGKFKVVGKNNDGIIVRMYGVEDVINVYGDELKLVFPQTDTPPEKFAHLQFKNFFLQPMADGQKTAANTRQAIDYCMAHPQWRLSIQSHKIIGIK